MSRAAAVLDLLRREGRPLAPFEIAAALKIQVRRVTNTLSSLHRAGRIAPAGHVSRPPGGILSGPTRTRTWKVAAPVPISSTPERP